MYQAIILAFALAVSIIAGPLAVRNAQLTSQLMSRNETLKRLDAAVSAMVLRAGTPPAAGQNYGAIETPGTYLLKPDVYSGAYPILPPIVGMPSTTATGLPFLYCPFAPDIADGPVNTSADYVQQDDGRSYSLFYMRDVPAKTDYLVRVDHRPAGVDEAGIAGVIVAPKATGAVLSCLDIRIVGGRPVIDGGWARAIRIRRGGVSASPARTLQLFVSPSGSGDGGSARTPAALARAWDVVTSRRPDRMLVLLADGDYDASALAMPTRAGASSHVVFRSSDGNPNNGAPRLVGTVVVVDLQVDFDGVGTSAATPIRVDAGGEFLGRNAGFGPIFIASGGRGVLDGSVTIDGSGEASAQPAFDVEGAAIMSGSVLIRGARPLQVEAGGELLVASPLTLEQRYQNEFAARILGRLTASAPLVVSGASDGMLVSGTGSVAIRGTAATFNQAAGHAGVTVSGGARFSASQATIGGTGGVLISVLNGGALDFGSSVADARSFAIGVRVDSARQVSGGASVVRSGSTACWAGAAPLVAGTIGARSSILLDAPYAGSSPVTAASLSVDASTAVNAFRRQWRGVFSADWSCAA